MLVHVILQQHKQGETGLVSLHGAWAPFWSGMCLSV